VGRPAFAVNRIGYGVGHRDGSIPNVLRVCLGEQAAAEEQSELWMLECNIDDMNPEYYDHVLGRLLTAGALDAWLTPVQMKKNRPGILLSVLCPPPLALYLSQLLFIETTTLGIRDYPVKRTALAREIVVVTTCYGKVAVKVAYLHGRPLHSKPEYEDCKLLALEQGVPLHLVYAEAQAALNSRQAIQQDA